MGLREKNDKMITCRQHNGKIYRIMSRAGRYWIDRVEKDGSSLKLEHGTLDDLYKKFKRYVAEG